MIAFIVQLPKNQNHFLTQDIVEISNVCVAQKHGQNNICFGQHISVVHIYIYIYSG